MTTHSSSKRFFILLFSTRSGYKQSFRFHLADAVDFDGYDEETRHAFILHALGANGVDFKMVSPDAPIVLQVFATERDCTLAYQRVRGDRRGPAPQISGRN